MLKLCSYINTLNVKVVHTGRTWTDNNNKKHTTQKPSKTQTYFSFIVIGTIFMFHKVSECERLSNMWLQRRAPPSLHILDRRALIMEFMKSLNLPVSRESLRNLCGNISSQRHTLCGP